MTRQIIFDTETTGLKPEEGHRVIEIGCVEMVNRKLTGNNFHYYLNPHRDIDAESIRIHGLTKEFLSRKPSFCHIVEEFLDYIKGAELIAHNARFDEGFLNHELSLVADNIGKQVKITDYATISDSLALAKKMHPGQRNSLDALCKRYSIDNAHRDLHGALLDSQLLAEVYLAMTGGQTSLDFFEESSSTRFTQNQTNTKNNIKNDQNNMDLQNNTHNLVVIKASEQELEAHHKFLELLNKSCESGNIWQAQET